MLPACCKERKLASAFFLEELVKNSMDMMFSCEIFHFQELWNLMTEKECGFAAAGAVSV